jgi:hypothetical protein
MTNMSIKELIKATKQRYAKAGKLEIGKIIR